MAKQRLSKAQITGLLRQEGFPEEVIPTMVGIAGGESRFNPQAHNPDASTGDNSYGLFQINMLGGMGPERRQLFGIKSNEELFDPVKNVKAAKAIYDRQGLGAWSVYSSGAYKDHLPTAEDLQGATVPPGTLSSELPGTISPEQTQTVGSGGNVLNVYFDRGSQHQDKKDKAKSLVEQMKEGIIMGMLGQALDPTVGMASGAFDPYKAISPD